MLLKDYFPNIGKKYEKTFFSDICFESSKVKKDNVFFAIKGTNIDGNNFILDAINKGSKIIVTEKKITKFPNGVLIIHSKNVRKLLAEVSFKIYNKKPSNLIAITGTNGKSSVADFYYQILKFNKRKVASIGTLGVKSNNKYINLSNTTIDPIQLGKILNYLKNQKVDDVILEASSHGLSQNRLDGLKFNSGIFTNLSQDHLDYHKNLKDYLIAKLYLFEKLLSIKGNVITDEKIPEFRNIKKISLKRNLKIYSINNPKNHFKILSHYFVGEKQMLTIKYKNLIKNIKLNLIGKIQLKNIMMAIIAAQKSNLSLNKILAVIPKIRSVEGRLEKIGNIKNKSKVILDYAHTPDALKISLLSLREQFPNKKIVLLFGCGGNRDQNKRSKMGKIASLYADQIYLTDDNPRLENPNKIRKDIKRGINSKKISEISDRAKAISEAVKNLTTGNILLVAGKGHEKIQEIGNRKIYFSDKKIILNAIKLKNLNLSNNLKLNLIKESSGDKKLNTNLTLGQARINSKEVKKNDIFFAIRGRKNDGNKFVEEALKKKASIVVVNKIKKKLDYKKQIKVIDSLKFLTKTSSIFRENIDAKIIAITGSCGKTTLKELLGKTLKKISKTTISPKSYNNKYGVPLSLFNLSKNDNYGVLEVGMDKKGEIDYLSKIIKPDISVITNINYAHAKNFKNIKDIALAKSEIISNTKPNGFVILNADDNFFRLHQKIATKNNINTISFGIKNHKSDVKLINIIKINNNFKINIKAKDFNKSFVISNNFQNNIYNILAALAVMSINIDITKLDKKVFFNFTTPQGRGDLSRIKINKKNINLIDESYNSNPLSLKSAILNYDKVKSKKSKKYLLLGDMLELGTHSKKLHQSIVPIINKTKIDKIFLKGNYISQIFKKIVKSKRGKVFRTNSQMIKFIKNDLNNNDYLMVKASNATGFNKMINDLKGIK